MAIPGQHSERVQPVLRAEVEPPTDLRRILGTWDLVLMIIGTVIGSVISLVPGVILRAAPAYCFWRRKLNDAPKEYVAHA